MLKQLRRSFKSKPAFDFIQCSSDLHTITPSSSDTEGIEPVIVEADSGRNPLVQRFAKDQGKAFQMEGLVPEILVVVEG